MSKKTIKQKNTDPFLELLLSGTARLRKWIDPSVTVDEFFTQEQLRILKMYQLLTQLANPSGTRLSYLTTLVGRLANVDFSTIHEFGSPDRGFSGAICRLTANPNSNNYGSEWFVTLGGVETHGVRLKDGSLGNHLPEINKYPDCYVVATDDDVIRLYNSMNAIGSLQAVKERFYTFHAWDW